MMGGLSNFELTSTQITRMTPSEPLLDAQHVQWVYQAALSSTADHIFALNLNYRFLYANRAMLAAWGLSWEEAAGKNCREIGYPEWQAERHEREFAHVIETGEPFHGEVPFTGPLGTRFYSYIFSPVRGADGQIEGIAGTSRDITEEKRTLEALRVSEERAQLALTAANWVGTWDWDVQQDRLVTDAEFARAYGVDPKAAIAGAPVAEYLKNVHPEDRKRVEDAVSRTIQTGQLYAEEYRLIQADGSIRWVAATGRIQRDEGGALRFPGVTIDITERKNTENALRDTEAKFNAMYSTSLEYIGLLTPAGVVIDCNRASLEFGSNTREEAIGKNFWESGWFAHTPDAPQFVRQAIAQAASGESFRSEVTLRRPQGETCVFDFSLQPVRNAAGEVIFLVPEGRDITELKQAEAALLQSEKLAAVGRLAASIAHEINNPLESVTNLLYLAHRAATLAEIHEHLETAERELRRVSVISNQTLRFYKQSTHPRPVAIDDLIDNVLSVYQGRIVNSRVAVKSRFRPTRPLVCLDGEIRQVLYNLVGNAIDAMHPVGGRLLIYSREGTNGTGDRQGVCITVADTGCGMSEQTLRKLFQPFFTTKDIGGTGLGLWVSKEIIERHRGTVRVRSSQKQGNSGSVFHLFLPFDGVSRPATI
jgi:PAS domain S-box-containing protein